VIKQLATAGALLVEEYKEKNIQPTFLDGIAYKHFVLIDLIFIYVYYFDI